MPKFVKIGQSIAEILSFLKDFSRLGLSAILDLFGVNLDLVVSIIVQNLVTIDVVVSKI